MIQPLDNWNSDATLRTFYNAMYRCVVNGREMQKCGDDLDRYTEVITRSRPEVIVETGTRFGGSAWWFHTRFNVPVVTVDISHLQLVAGAIQNDPGIIYIEAPSADPSTLLQVKQHLGGRRTMVSLDSDHHAPHVFDEITQYGQLVSPGCYMVVEDACFDMWSGEDSRRGGAHIPERGGPLKAIQLAHLDKDPRWVRDVEIEGWTDVSHSPCGWWQRA